MTNEEILQGTLNATLDRISKQSRSYEADIANLNAQIIVLNSQIQELMERKEEVKPEENDS